MPANHQPVWLSAEAGSPDDFKTLITQETQSDQVPNATEIVKNVPIYRGDFLGQIDRKTLMAEWVNVLSRGAGVIVIRAAYCDTAPVDRATKVFETLIDAEKAAGIGAGDHFAKPGANDRVWNAVEKHCLADPEGFARYYANPGIALIAEAWLGPAYQVTAQVNRVNPGGKAQNAHRDYHLGFMTPDQIVRYPAHVHQISPVLTLQGAVAHCDMPIESGPTQILPFSQQFFEGYLAFTRPEFQKIFAENRIQLPLNKGDAIFFNPALMHAAGDNVTTDIFRMANLLQISSGFGRAMESVDRTQMCKLLYPALQSLGLPEAEQNAAINAAAALVGARRPGRRAPTNLDRDPPVGGMAPKSQADHMREALASGMKAHAFAALMDGLDDKRLTN